jgi:methionine-R-sulfoxide reductase
MSKVRNELTANEAYVLLHKGTEPPFTGEYDQFFEDGYYVCRHCDAKLYESSHKFHSGCGWPAFDNEVDFAIERVPDKDGRRTEIVCAECKGHLGHIFHGERLTPRNVRHCVNSLSIRFIPQKKD